ncbi:MAG: Smr/MutS family protein [Reyranellaceae bacterium]
MAKDVDLFRRAMADVTPLVERGRRRARRAPRLPDPPQEAAPAAPPPAVPPSALPTRSVARRNPSSDAKLPEVELHVADRVFDRDIARSLGRGKIGPQAAIDLHGMTLAAAERAVSTFLDRSVAQDLRVVLVVTGKGIRLEGGRVFGGRIRSEFLGWLDRPDNRARVRGVRPAHPRHGGGGAFYVLLRRRSSASSRSLRATPQR